MSPRARGMYYAAHAEVAAAAHDLECRLENPEMSARERRAVSVAAAKLRELATDMEAQTRRERLKKSAQRAQQSLPGVPARAGGTEAWEATRRTRDSVTLRRAR